MNNTRYLLNNITNKIPPCELLDNFLDWQNKIDNEVLTILHVNIRNTPKNWDLMCSKLNNVLPILDCLVLTEIKMKEDEAVAYQLRNFTQLNKCRTYRNGGGVMIFYKDCWEVENLGYNFDEAESINIRLTHFDSNVNFIISAIYRSPKNNLDRFLNDLGFWLKNGIKKDDNVILVGDINCCTLKKKSENTKYLNILYENTIIPTINKPTREEMVLDQPTISCIDHINIRLNVNICCNYTSTVITDKVADHYFVATRVSRRERTNIPRRTEIITIFDNKEIQRKIENRNWDELLECNDTQVTYEKMVSMFKEIYKSSTKPAKKTKYNNAIPWVNDKVMEEIRKKQTLLKSWRNNKNNRLIYEQYKIQRNVTTNIIKKEKRIYLFKAFQETRGDMQGTWRLINQLMDRKIKESLEVKLKRNFRITDSSELANKFNCNFIKQIRDIKNKNGGPILDVQFNDYVPHGVNSSMYLRKASESEIKKILKGMKRRGRGIDGIRNVDIIDNWLIFTPVITHLVNLMIQNALIPQPLKTSCITPLYKKGKIDELGNYRPVGSMPIIEKVLEKHINILTKKYLHENHIIPEFQHGFQSGRSTMTLLQEFSNLINTALDQRKCVVVLLLDLSFAFDCTKHDSLLRKFKEIGISHPILTHYFEGRSQRTRIGDTLSAELPVELGLIQGACNSPTWYNIYTYDVKYIARTGSLYMFADDTCIISIHKDVEKAVEIAQKDFINLLKYLYNNEIYLNDKKTEALVLGYKSKEMDMSNHQIYCHNRLCLSLKTYEGQCSCQQVEYKDNARYLGMYLDREFQMKPHALNLNKKLRILNYKFKKINIEYLPFTTKKTIYFSLIDSILRYGVTLYTYAPKYEIEPICKLQGKIKRLLFGNKNVGILTPEKLAIFTHLCLNFSNEKYRQMIQHSYTLRIQRFRRPKVYSIEFGDRRLEYLIPTLLNTYCQEFLDEEKKEIIKQKVKKSLLSHR